MADLPQFVLTQYDWLKKEIDTDVAETRKLEQTALYGTVAVWAWVLTQAPHKGYASMGAWLLTYGAVLLCAIRCWAISQRIATKAKYIRLIEEKYPAAPGLEGWDTFFAKPENKESYLGKSAALFWGLLLTATFLAPVLFDWYWLVRHWR
jgi:hypothetical protein